MKLRLNVKDPHIKAVMQDTTFLDIETSLVDARVFRSGTQFVGAHQLSSTTKLLTVAGGTMYDLYTKGADGMWSFGNHQADTFEENPLDDTFVLARLWDILDKARVVVAHNARFDTGCINGRFLELGWPLPSKYSVVCTYQALRRYNLTSKKLDQLSKTLVGAKKIPTDFTLWDRCSNGEVAAFEEMLEYNRGDIRETLFEVYLRLAPYAPDYAVDFANYREQKLTCKVDGGKSFNATAKVVRFNTDPGSPVGYGMHFVNLESTLRDEIQSMVDQMNRVLGG